MYPMSREGKATLTLQTLKKMRLFHKEYLILLLEFWLYLGTILHHVCVKHATFLLMGEVDPRSKFEYGCTGYYTGIIIVFSIFYLLHRVRINYRLIAAYLLLRVNLDKMMHAC